MRARQEISGPATGPTVDLTALGKGAKAAIFAPPDGEWDDVPQDTIRSMARSDCALRLGQVGKHGMIRLWLSLSVSVTARFRWDRGTPLVMAVGRTGAAKDWLRFSSAGGGRALRFMGRQQSVLVAMLDPGERLGGFEAPRRPAEWRVAGDALLVRIPWDLPEADAAGAPEASA